MLKKAVFLLVLFCAIDANSNPLNPSSPTNVTDSGDIESAVLVAGNSTGFLLTCQDSGNNLISSFTTPDGMSWTTALLTDVNAFTSTMWVTGTTDGFLTAYIEQTIGYTTGLPYSVFSTNGNAWSTPSAIDSDPEVVTPFSVCGTTAGVMATWHTAMDGNAYSSFSTNDGTAWGSIMPITNTGNVNDRAVIVAGYGSNFVATWASDENTFASYYNGTNWSVTPTQITMSTDVISDVWVGANSAGFMAVWVNYSNNAYASFSSNGTSWSSPAQIPTGITLLSQTNISICGSTSGFVVAWIGNDNNAYASMSADNGNSWSTPVQITGDGSVLTGYSDDSLGVVGVSAVGTTCVFTWLGQMVVLGRSSATATPGDVYSSVSGLPGPPVGGVQPPASVNGSQKTENSGIEYRFYNAISWGPSPTPGVAGYNIYINGSLFTSVSPSTYSFVDNNVKKNKTITYSVTAFNESGESTPVTITLK